MGTVYRARDLESGRAVALKTVKAEEGVDLVRFAREAEMLATMKHPGIVRYVAHGVMADNRPYLVQEWIEGVSLQERLATEGLTIGESVRVAIGVATALAEAHEVGVVHRDLKPSNLILEHNLCEQVRLLDFGIARSSSQGVRLTRTGHAVGTPGYMAPEQAAGRSSVDARADVFGLGCVLYFCLAGMPPFPGHNATAVRTKLLMCDPPALRPRCPEAPDELLELLESMLEKSRERRPPNAGAVLAQLETIEIPESVTTRRVQILNAPTVAIGEADGSSTDLASLGSDQFVSMVLIRDSIDEGESSLNDEQLDELRDAVKPFGSGLERIVDDCFMMRLQGEPLTCATKAARCALVLAKAVPTAGVAISSGARAALASIIESGTQNLEGAVLERLFSADSSPRVHLDSLTAELLEERFAVEAEGSRRFILRGKPGDEEVV